MNKQLLSINIPIIVNNFSRAYDKNMAINRLYEAAYRAEVKSTGKMPAPSFYMSFNEVCSRFRFFMLTINGTIATHT